MKIPRFQKNTFFQMLLLALLAGCSSLAPASAALPAGNDQISEVDSSWNTFSSAQSGSSVAYPADWLVVERDGEWNRDRLLYPENEGLGLGALMSAFATFDTFANPDLSAFVAVGAKPITAETTLFTWVGSQTEDFARQFGSDCGDPQLIEMSTLAGEPAVKMAYTCSGGYSMIYLYAVHASQGYVFLWRSAAGNEKAGPETFNQFISAFAFTQ